MDANKLKGFVSKISDLRTAVLASSVSSAGFGGTMSSQDAMLETLKRNVAAFAEEYTKPAPNLTTLRELGDEVEGGLQGLHSMSVIDDSKLDILLNELHDLKK